MWYKYWPVAKNKIPKQLYDVTLTVFLSFLTWPIMRVLNNGFALAAEENRSILMMATFSTFFLSTGLILSKISKLQHWEGYVFMMFAITGLIANLIAVEFLGYVSGFVSQYLKFGEPYFLSPWGSAIALFDGTILYLIYLRLIFLVSNGKPWRSLGIYWASSMVHSLIVLWLGIFTGIHSPTCCTLINIPYTLIPGFILVRPQWNEDPKPEATGKILQFFLAASLTYSIVVTFSRGMLSLGSKFPVFCALLQHEPALLDFEPAPFLKIQSVVGIFYALPIQVISLSNVYVAKRPAYLWDLGLINGGYFLQAQFTFILTALHPQTKENFQSQWFDWQFWINNLTVLLVPQLFIWMLYKNHHVHK